MALVGLFDTSATVRQQYGCAAETAYTAVAKYVLDGEINMQTGNRWSDGTPQWFLTPDLLAGGGYLNSSDQTTVRQLLALVGYVQVNSLIGSQAVFSGCPSACAFNTSAQFTAGGAPTIVYARAMMNNYTQARNLALVSTSLFFDDTTGADPLIATGSLLGFKLTGTGASWAAGDQCDVAGGGGVGQITYVSGGVPQGVIVVTPSTGYTNTGSPVSCTAVSPSVGTGLTVVLLAGNTCGTTRDNMCSDGSAANLHAYWSYVDGGMLYKYYATQEDPAVALGAYSTAYGLSSIPNCTTYWGVSVPCFGSSRGGEASEGTNYGNSYTSSILAFNAIINAGYDNPHLYGPQMSAVTADYSDLRYVADLNLLNGLSGVPSQPSVWNFITNGDSNTYITYPSGYTTEAALLAQDAITGRTDRANALEWLVLNSASGLADGTAGGCTAGPAPRCGFINSIDNEVYGAPVAPDMFIALPAANPVTTASPRPRTP